jgi:hypothetical protein
MARWALSLLWHFPVLREVDVHITDANGCDGL